LKRASPDSTSPRSREIELVRSVSPDARLAFMHPVKSRAAITKAYFDHGVRTFSLDCHDELEKILDATGQAKDLNLIVRMAVSADGAAYTLSGKFGVSPDQAPSLLLATRQAVKDGLMGVSFHVGSQCMRPTAYQAAMAQVSRSISRAGVIVDIVDIGGGFPSVYPGMVPPDMSEYADAIHRGFNEMPVSETTELWCEPGRALVAESSSVLCRVDLRKGDALYLNDGSYGALFDATHSRWPFPTRLVRDGAVLDRAEAVPLLRPDLRFHRPHAGTVLAAGRCARGRLHRDRHAGRLWRGHVDRLQRLRRARDSRGRGRADGVAVRPGAPLHPDRAHHGRGAGSQGRPPVAPEGQGGRPQTTAPLGFSAHPGLCRDPDDISPRYRIWAPAFAGVSGVCFTGRSVLVRQGI
jgi:hypothetical protein